MGISRTANNLSHWRGDQPNALIAGRVDSNAQVVGDKTGYSLTAGSYVTRASSSQRGTAQITGTNLTASGTIASVTTTRAECRYSGNTYNTTTFNWDTHGRVALTAATTVTATRGTAADLTSNTLLFGFDVSEYF